MQTAPAAASGYDPYYSGHDEEEKPSHKYYNFQKPEEVPDEGKYPGTLPSQYKNHLSKGHSHRSYHPDPYEKDEHYTSSEHDDDQGEHSHYGKEAHGRGAGGDDDDDDDDAHKHNYEHEDHHERHEDGDHRPYYGYDGQDQHEGDHSPGYGDEDRRDNGEPDVFKVCLQEYTRENPETQTDPTKSKFKCCTPADAPDACLTANQMEPGYDGYGHHDQEEHRGYDRDTDASEFLNQALNTDSAAVCAWSFEASLCPPHLLKTCLGSGTLNCTLARDAHKCGSPFKTLSFTAKGYFVGYQAQSCAQIYPVQPIPAPGPNLNLSSDSVFYTGTAWAFEGHIVASYTDGESHVRGSVEFVASIAAAESSARRLPQKRQLLEAATTAAAPAPAPAKGAAAAPLPAQKAAPAAAKPAPAATPKVAAPVPAPAPTQPAPAAAAAFKPVPAAAPTKPAPAAAPTKPAPAAAKPTPAQPVKPAPAAAAQPAPIKPAKNTAPAKPGPKDATPVVAAAVQPAPRNTPHKSPEVKRQPQAPVPHPLWDLPLVKGGSLKLKLFVDKY